MAKPESPNATVLIVCPNINLTPDTDTGGELVVPTTDEDDCNSDKNDKAFIPYGLYNRNNEENIISEMFLEDAVNSESKDNRDEVEVLIEAVESISEGEGSR